MVFYILLKEVYLLSPDGYSYFQLTDADERII